MSTGGEISLNLAAAVPQTEVEACLRELVGEFECYPFCAFPGWSYTIELYGADPDETAASLADRLGVRVATIANCSSLSSKGAGDVGEPLVVVPASTGLFVATPDADRQSNL
ncbi:MAG: hypothetical protein LBI84_03530 [Propionibacteriaceae bacterium]|nr:hypothetical protein [Propionibacteriaceae bacterium]